MRLAYHDKRAGVRLYEGDCLDVLEELAVEISGQVRLLLSDPPYGQQFAGKGVLSSKANIRGDGARQGVRLVRKMLVAARPLLAPDAHTYLFCHWESYPDFYDCASSHINVKNALIWDKNRGGMGDTQAEYARDCEFIVYGTGPERRALRGRRDGCVLRGFAPVPPTKRIHPTEKPAALLEYLIEKSTEPGDLVLDPFGGSGNVGAAARRLGRRAIVIELDPGNVRRAISERLALGLLEAA